MNNYILNQKKISKFEDYLYLEERSQATIQKYVRDVVKYYEFLDGDKLMSKESLIAYKNDLLQKYKVRSVNSMLTSLNSFLMYQKLNELKMKLCKVQKKIFYEEEKELTKEEYKRLLEAALKEKNKQLYMLLQTICGTGIRVSEHKFITVECLRTGRVVINNKGKERVIFITKKLRRLLIDYCNKSGIISGTIFITKKGEPLDRSNIWRKMKNLCEEAKVDREKVFPHNLRHLFALTYYRLQKDIIRLADILGHTNIETTRIYTMTSCNECEKTLAKMNLVGLLC
ncbi:tyrosine-type recombinase/integrase [Amedibacillus sp. YH-ame10]